jgi:CBS domain-containing protein
MVLTQGFIMPFVEVRAMLKVKDVMVTNVVTVDVDVSVKDAVERMNVQEIGCLVVLEKGHYAGILTERDVLTRVVAKAHNPENISVGQVMSKPLTVANPETSLEEAVKLMLEKKVKKLPVIENEKLVGLITMTGIASTHPGMMKFIRELSTKYDIPKRIKKVIDYYVV